MSEKRFTATDRFRQFGLWCFDEEQDKYLDATSMVWMLNEQQATINKQLDQIIELQDKYRILEFNHSRLEKRNKAQYKKISEQQSTIQQKDKQLEKAKEYFMDYLSREMSANNFSELWDLVVDDE